MVHSYFFGSTGQRFIVYIHIPYVCEERKDEVYNRAETKQSRAQPPSRRLVYGPCTRTHLSLGLSTCTRSLYQPDIYVQNFLSVVELDVSLCPKPKRATGLSRSHKISILRCPNLQVLQCVPALDICNRLSHAQKDHRLPK